MVLTNAGSYRLADGQFLVAPLDKSPWHGIYVWWGAGEGHSTPNGCCFLVFLVGRRGLYALAAMAVFFLWAKVMNIWYLQPSKAHNYGKYTDKTHLVPVNDKDN